MKLKELTEAYTNFEVDVDLIKLQIIEKYLAACARKGIIRHTSPQFVLLLKTAMEFSEKKVDQREEENACS